ncbi:MAG TPA: L,D-transpeptidase family protein [Sphingomicrobium sp.]|jgi:murein L,D-transpeptidase YafK|nr:L,D-transpeptidase family protein [Sphingomicrobium sp.]
MPLSLRPIGRSAVLASLAALLMMSCMAPRVEDRTSAHVATRLVVLKRAHVLRAYRGNQLLREFKVALGVGGLKPKLRQGDGRVPEGEYVIDGRNPKSAFHLSLHISYPTPHQRRIAAAQGVDPGGAIMIHGLPNGQASVGQKHRVTDWTEGCIAVTDPEIEWIWRSVPDGTPILITP